MRLQRPLGGPERHDQRGIPPRLGKLHDLPHARDAPSPRQSLYQHHRGQREYIAAENSEIGSGGRASFALDFSVYLSDDGFYNWGSLRGRLTPVSITAKNRAECNLGRDDPLSRNLRRPILSFLSNMSLTPVTSRWQSSRVQASVKKYKKSFLFCDLSARVLFLFETCRTSRLKREQARVMLELNQSLGGFQSSKLLLDYSRQLWIFDNSNEGGEALGCTTQNLGEELATVREISRDPMDRYEVTKLSTIFHCN